MPRYIAFLRAINVGGRVVKMERLRQAFSEIGLFNIETFIASGNVIFESQSTNEEPLCKKIETQLARKLGYKVDTFLRNEAGLREIAQHQPFKAGEMKGADRTVYVAFLSAAPPAAAKTKLMNLRGEVDDFQLHGREVYWLLRRKTMSESLFSGALLEKTLGMSATMRNFNTVTRLAAKLAPSR